MGRKRKRISPNARDGDHETFATHFAPVVDRMIENGTQFQDIEEYIEAAPLSTDLKNALWLWAWSAITSPRQRWEILFDADLVQAS